MAWGVVENMVTIWKSRGAWGSNRGFFRSLPFWPGDVSQSWAMASGDTCRLVGAFKMVPSENFQCVLDEGEDKRVGFGEGGLHWRGRWDFSDTSCKKTALKNNRYKGRWKASGKWVDRQWPGFRIYKRPVGQSWTRGLRPNWRLIRRWRDEILVTNSAT